MSDPQDTPHGQPPAERPLPPWALAVAEFIDPEAWRATRTQWVASDEAFDGGLAEWEVDGLVGEVRLGVGSLDMRMDLTEGEEVAVLATMGRALRGLEQPEVDPQGRVAALQHEIDQLREQLKEGEVDWVQLNGWILQAATAHLTGRPISTECEGGLRAASLIDMLKAGPRTKATDGPGQISMTCDPRGVAAIYVALHFEADPADDCEPIDVFPFPSGRVAILNIQAPAAGGGS